MPSLVFVEASAATPVPDAARVSHSESRLYLQAADLIAARLRSGDLSFASNEEHGRANDNLYGGPLGVALFLSAHAQVTGQSLSRDAALEMVEPALRLNPFEAANAPGGLVGRGALIHALTRMGPWLEAPQLVEWAHTLTLGFEPERMRQDSRYDLTSGLAGAILVLLALGPSMDAPNRAGHTPLVLAQVAAEHLLERRVRTPQGPRAWPTSPGGPCRTGMAHGATGICLALARLAQRKAETRWMEAVQEALDFEELLFDPAAGNWFQSSQEHRTLMGWCYGAPGMALGYHGILQALPHLPRRAALELGLRNALDAVLRFSTYPMDHLCCGTLGVVEVMHQLGRRTGDATLSSNAHRLTLRMLRAAKGRGGFLLGTGDSHEPSLFQGLAGVGYTLLRLARPEQLPSLLTLE